MALHVTQSNYLDGRGQEGCLGERLLVWEEDAEGEAKCEQQRDEGKEEMDEAGGDSIDTYDLGTSFRTTSGTTTVLGYTRKDMSQNYKQD